MGTDFETKNARASWVPGCEWWYARRAAGGHACCPLRAAPNAAISFRLVTWRLRGGELVRTAIA